MHKFFLFTLAIPILYFSFINNHSASWKVKFQKIVIDSTFYSESAKAADLNRDGKLDIIAGDVWYEAPDWIKHEIREAGTYLATLVQPDRPMGSGARYYCRSIGNYVKDINKDGWLDIVTFNSQGSSCYWYQNPQGADGHWKEHVLMEISHNEAPQLLDLFSDNDLVPFSGLLHDDSLYSLCWFTPKDNLADLWQHHTIGHPDDFHFSREYPSGWVHYAPGGWGHGLGIGDINGDGIQDVIAAQGWYEGPSDGRERENWTFHRVPFDSMADPEKIHLLFAQMYADDFDGDGDNDIIGGSAHAYGLWWFEQVRSGDDIDFVKHDISMEFSQLHSMGAADLNGDGVKDYVSGKRYLAHLGRDPGWDDPVSLFWVEPARKGKGKVEFKIHVIDEDTGAGTQVDLVDMNGDGKTDILTSNKKGTHLFLQR
jgi:hypothetical protein